MRTIIVDGDRTTLNRFARLSAGIPDIHLVGQFDCVDEALAYSKEDPVELVFIDLSLLKVRGILLAAQLRKNRPDILIVFISENGRYLADSNKMGVDYYIAKPYSRKTLEMVMERIRLIACRLYKKLYIRTFGGFLVIKDDKPLFLTGKAKEILALVVAQKGKEISNEQIYRTLWEGREYSNSHMTVYYNAVCRLKAALKKGKCESLLISTARGLMVDTALFDCDFYAWQDNSLAREAFAGSFLPEYPWAKAFHSTEK